MVDSTTLDRVQRYLSLQTVPEMFFGDSRLYVACPQRNLLISFSALDCLKLCSFREQERRVVSAVETSRILSEVEDAQNISAAQESASASMSTHEEQQVLSNEKRQQKL